MRKIFVILSVFCVAGCNTPSIGFQGIAPVSVTVEGSTFDVRINGLFAEAIRTNMEYAPRVGPIGKRARKAIEMVSGCDVAVIGGDQAVINASLDCGDGAPKLTSDAPSYECYNTRDIEVTDGVLENLSLECTPRY